MDLPVEEDFLIIPTTNLEEGCYVFFVVRIEGLGKGTEEHLNAKIVLKCSKIFHKLCVVGFVVYLFSEDRAVGTINLSPFLSSSEDKHEEVLTDETIRYISPMKSEKRTVEAVPTPSRKVLAFSRSISLGSCFELYDPDTGIWEDVPQIEQHCPAATSMREIKFYFFTDNHTFVVQASSGKTYQLDFEYPTSKSRWHDCGRSVVRSPLGGFSRAVLGGSFELCLSHNAVWDVKNIGGVHKAVARFPSSTFHTPFETRMIISSGRWSRCYVLEIASMSRESYLSIQEYHMELVEFFDEKKALEEKYIEEQKALEKKKAVGELEEKFFDRLEMELLNRMKLTSPNLVCFPLRMSVFFLGRSHRLEDETTFSI